MKIWISFLALAALLTGCGKTGVIEPPAAGELRILSLVTAADNIIVELGAKEKIAAIDRHGRVLPAMKDVPVTVAGGMVSREMLREYKINHAIIWYYQKNLLEVFQKENISVTIVEQINLSNYSTLVRNIGKLVDKKSEAEEVIKRFDSLFAEKTLQAKNLQPVYLELYSMWKSPRKDGYTAQILQCAGGKQAVSGSVNGTVSAEAVALSEPEIIFFVENFNTADELARRPALRNTPAVKNKRIYAIPRKLVCEGVAPEELLDFFKNKIKEL